MLRPVTFGAMHVITVTRPRGEFTKADFLTGQIHSDLRHAVKQSVRYELDERNERRNCRVNYLIVDTGRNTAIQGEVKPAGRAINKPAYKGYEPNKLDLKIRNLIKDYESPYSWSPKVFHDEYATADQLVLREPDKAQTAAPDTPPTKTPQPRGRWHIIGRRRRKRAGV